MAKCLVTGGSGFIGSHLVDKLVELGHYVVNIDNESAVANSKFYKNYAAENYKKDITDYKSIEPLFNGIEYVFHLASDARIQLAIDNPSRSIDVNCKGTFNVLEASKNNNVKTVIYSSTSSLYGNTSMYPSHESNPTDPQTVYSASKQFSENLLKMYPELNTASLRYFNVYGDRQPTEGKYATVIGLFLKQKKEGLPLTVVGNGMQTRDFTHVDDVVRANLLTAFTNIKMNGNIYNVGTGTNYSILQIAQFISKNIEFIPERIGELDQTLADNSKMFNTFNWEPSINLKDWLKNEI
jgi:UDP-glucose 4-epimerase